MITIKYRVREKEMAISAAKKRRTAT